MRNERGFALVATLLALLVLTALAAAGMMLSGTDSDISENTEASVRAFHVADAGLATYVGTRVGTPSGTQTITVPGGNATVTSRKLSDLAPGRGLHQLTSRGLHQTIAGDAVRRLGAVVVTGLPDVDPPASLASGRPIHKNGGSGEMNGYDGATSSDCPTAPQPARAGVAVPPGGYIQDGGSSVPEGDPDILEQDSMALLEATGVDWPAVIDGTEFPFDYVVSEDGWPDFDGISEDEYPVVYADGSSLSVDSNDDGQGTLIVRGDLLMNGSFHWDGIVLVGGSITSDGNQIIHGATISGLNLLLGEEVTETNLGNGTKSFRYHSCNVAAALSRLSWMSVEPGSWYEEM